MPYYNKGFNDGPDDIEALNTTSQSLPKLSLIRLRPCDCICEVQAKTLNEQGISVNDESIEVHPNYVLLTMGHTQVKIGMKRFKMFAEWYLTHQILKTK